MGERNLWDEVLALLDGKMNRFIFFSWFRAVRFLSYSDGLLRVAVPNALFREWFLARYAPVVDEALANLGRPGTSVNYVVVPQVQSHYPSPFAHSQRSSPHSQR